MGIANESLGEQSPLESALDQGIEQLGVRQTVRFQKFTKYTFAADGFVFWVASSEFADVVGTLHISTERRQDEDQTIAANMVLLTAEKPITEFNAIDPLTMWIGAWPVAEDPTGPTLPVAFASRGALFGPANVWHYSGYTVYPALQAQIVQTVADLPDSPIVSDSMPIWLSLGTFTGGETPTTVPVYPAFLVSDNLRPPYIAVKISSEQTVSLQASPLIGPWPGKQINSDPSPLHALAGSALCRDEVELTLYGFSNSMAWQYFANLIDASLTGLFGFANSPAITDPPRPQAEIAAIAMKKCIRISANYDQGTANATALRLILSACINTWTILDPLGEVIATAENAC